MKRRFFDVDFYNEADYIVIDQSLSDPLAIISGDVRGPEVQYIRDNSHRYVGRYDSSLGSMCISQLDDSDSYLYADGSYAGYSGERYVRIPRFYYHCEHVDSDKWRIGLSRGKVAPDWKEWDGNDLIGVYKAYANLGLSCESGKNPSYGTIAQFERALNFYQDNRSIGFSLVRWRHHCIMALLFYAYYGNTNCQAVVGSGTSSSMKVTGATDGLGMEDTVAGGNGDTGSINFWGLENWWGDSYEWTEDVSVNANQWTIKGLDGDERVVESVSSAGVITKMFFGDDFDLVPTAVNNYSYTQGFCDYFNYDGTLSRVVCRSWDGLSAVNTWYDGNSAFETVGTRKCYRGPITEVSSSYFS